MNPQFQEIVSPRQLRQSPIRDSGLQPRSQIPSQSRGLRPPGGFNPSGRIPPPQAGLKQQPLNLFKTPGSQLRAPVDFHPHAHSSLKPFQPPVRSTPIHASPSMEKVIPLPGSSSVLASIPRPSRRPDAPIGLSRISAPVRVVSTSLLPKPCFMRSGKTPISKIAPPSRLPPRTVRTTPQRQVSPPWQSPPKSAPITPRPSTAPTTPASASGVLPKTPARRPPTQLPRTAAKQRLVTEDSDAEVFHIAGRDIQFVDWAPSPETQPAPKSVKRPVAHPGKARIAKGFVRSVAAINPGDSPEGPTLPPPVVDAMRALQEAKTRKVYEFPDEPSVAAAKEFAYQINADLQRFRSMGADMSELKQRKAAIMSKVKSMNDRHKQEENASLDMEEFRTKYGITQSPKMRQLLEVAGEWNRVILEKRELAEGLAKAQPFELKARPKLVQTLQGLAEFPGESPQDAQQRSVLEQARQERVDAYQQRKEADKEYRRILEERKSNIASRRPYSKEERDDIRRRYQEAQEWTYTAPTEEELDNALKMAEIMELEEAGLSLVADPERTVATLFPGAAPSAQITSIVGDIPIPRNIPTEEINTINSLDRSTAEIALKASLVPVPAEGVTKKVLEASLQEMATATIKSIPQQLDPMYEIDLKLGQPKRKNYIQLQGSSIPSWFPGFYSIFPGAPGLVKAMKSPSTTLLTAFRQMQSSAASSTI
ncbi:uncharacterized protein LOC135707794 [Ochlerotatus camptorhynchus]|uniref:uncharacterized protein LOC135707794 n=1 Tax=Ochlerotatus camptorhynchus TaxID=644619 RepID=UPI0031D33EEA